MRPLLLPLLGALSALPACAGPLARIPGPLGPVGAAYSARTPAPRPSTAASETKPERRTYATRSRRSSGEGELGEATSLVALRFLDEPPPAHFRDDCSGYVEAVLDEVGVPLSGSTRQFYEAARAAGALHHRKLPAPGDLVFFDDTYDRDGDGQTNDPLTHIAVVVEVDGRGTITMAHSGTSRGRSTLKMNLLHPEDRRGGNGDEINEFLRRRRDGDPPETVYLASELWRAFATVRRADLPHWQAPRRS
jgi:hypothetical protein